MPEETTETKPEATPKLFENGKVDSQFLNISLRGWITVILVVTVCVMSGWGKKVEEPLYTLVGMAMGYYFGQKTFKN